MKGDFSRLTFDRAKHYSGVRMQQGRVQLDADWNEQMDILQHYFETEVTDFIGRSGVPADYAADVTLAPGSSFQVQITEQGTRVDIAPGRYYIAGKLFENGAPLTLTAAQLPSTPGDYVIYLDAWQCHVSPLEDPAIRELALGGPDTAARLQNVWQVGWESATTPPEASWHPQARVPRSTGGLRARVRAPGATLDNQLYRVEIHQGGAPDTATWKWSRDNGSVTAQITSLAGTSLTVSSAGRDPQMGFAAGQWVELSTVAQAQSGAPGFLVQLEGVQGNTFCLKTAPLDATPYTMVRRWDSAGAGALTPGPEHAGWLPLEQLIEVQFDSDSSRLYNAGDYWVFPARTLSGDIEWPREANDINCGPTLQAPHGVQHDYVPLAFVTLHQNVWSVAEAGDLRVKFRALDKGFVSKEGDTITGSLTITAAPDGTTPPLVVNSGAATYLTIAPDGGVTVAKATTLQDTLHVTQDVTIAGNIGIGTSAPGTNRLQVTGGPAQLDGPLTVDGLAMLNGGLTVGQNQATTLGGVLAVANATTLHDTLHVTKDVTIEGSVGIGTPSSPVQLWVDSDTLHVTKDVTIESSVDIDPPSSPVQLRVHGALSATAFQQGRHGHGAYLEWNRDNKSGMTYLLNRKGTGSGSVGGFVFGEVRDTGTTVDEVLRIDPSGQVGTGPNSLTAQLQVHGALSATAYQKGPHSQGAYLEWNRGDGDGRTYLLNQKGTGGGGFVFAEVVVNADMVQTVDEVLTIDSTTGDVRAAKGKFIGPTANGSDERSKLIRGHSDGASDLQTLLGISITDYTFKDTLAKGSAVYKKVIAQQVEQVFPQAVSQITGVVPDIYQKAAVKDGWVQLATQLQPGERVRLLGDTTAGLHAVLEVEPDRFRTDYGADDAWVFVYGREVKDFRIVDHEAIAMLNVSATQELHRRLEQQAADISARDAKIAVLEQRLTALEARKSGAATHASLPSHAVTGEEPRSHEHVCSDRAPGCATADHVMHDQVS